MGRSFQIGFAEKVFAPPTRGAPTLWHYPAYITDYTPSARDEQCKAFVMTAAGVRYARTFMTDGTPQTEHLRDQSFLAQCTASAVTIAAIVASGPKLQGPIRLPLCPQHAEATVLAPTIGNGQLRLTRLSTITWQYFHKQVRPHPYILADDTVFNRAAIERAVIDSLTALGETADQICAWLTARGVTRYIPRLRMGFPGGGHTETGAWTVLEQHVLVGLQRDPNRYKLPCVLACGVQGAPHDLKQARPNFMRARVFIGISGEKTALPPYAELTVAMIAIDMPIPLVDALHQIACGKRYHPHRRYV